MSVIIFFSSSKKCFFLPKWCASNWFFA